MEKGVRPLYILKYFMAILTLSEYQRLLDRYENVNDGHILPDLRLVVRLDAHRVGPEWGQFKDAEYPYHKSIVEGLTNTARRLMAFDIRMNYAFIHGDEISLLLDKTESMGLRRRARLISHLSSLATLFFREEMKLPVIFRAKLSELPSDVHVSDYFFWQRKVGVRNFFGRAFSLILEKRGLDEKAITQKISGLTEEATWRMAEELEIPLEQIPVSFIRGVGLWWEEDAGEIRLAIRDGLPDKDEEYEGLLSRVISGSSFLPKEEGVEIKWRVSETLPKATPTTPGKVRDNSSFRIGSSKGARIIERS